ncbi:hypothetical protein ACSNOH_29495 [Streptomyces sp. URMC 127]|uniref:hypothetical protein n=1 Tax=Streptomyces sp. URMC 127 TaxID=3423402 RepID=UPI003F1D0EFE
MDVIELLEAADLLVPESVATENDLTVNDVWDHLVHDEWEAALTLLEELRGGPPLPPAFWESLAGAATQLRLERSRAWCYWRLSESRHGVIRADLTLRPATESRRTTPVPGAGVLQAMWNIGHRSPAGEMSVSIAWLWVEDRPALEPGGRALVRLAPLTPSHWRHLRPGHRITMHEDRTVAGTATIVETGPPYAGL